MIDVADDELTEDMVKHLHYILKHDTEGSTLGLIALKECLRHCTRAQLRLCLFFTLPDIWPCLHCLTYIMYMLQYNQERRFQR